MYSQALLISNIYFCRHTGYFAQPAELIPLLHTWTLSVEEQFYLLFPFFLIALRGFPRHVLFSILFVFGVASFSLSVYRSYSNVPANYYLLPTRAWELSIGALLTMHPTRQELPWWLRESMSWAGFLAILYAVFLYDSKTRFPGVAAIFPCVGAALIIWANSSVMTSVGKILSLPPMVFIGLISYSLYLWHWPILVFARYLTPYPMSVFQHLLLLFVSVILAVLSWRFVETPFRNRSIFKSQVQILSFGGITTAVLLLAGLSINIFQGLPFRVPSQALAYATGSADKGFRTEVELQDALNGEFVEMGSGDKHLPVKLFVWGDSHAMMILSLLDTLCKEHAVRGVAATHSATLPLLDWEDHDKWSLKEDSVPYNQAVIKYIKNNQVGDVVLAACWGNCDVDPIGSHRCLIETINALRDSGARVWVMRDVPRPGWDVPRALTLAVMFHAQGPEGLVFPLTDYHKDLLVQDQLFQGISSPSSDTTILDPTKLFLNPKNQIIVLENNKCLYFDSSHLSVVGAMKLRPLFEPIFNGMVKVPMSARR